jgi:hypothetical protein
MRRSSVSIARAAERKLIETTPPDLVAFALQRVRFEKDGDERITYELLVAARPGGTSI